ncbi:MAG: DMT family transporter [Proteobacteria bacterium]|nr:DMT family transporter [Pseudomonadota bacterium]
MRHPRHVAICACVALASGFWGLYWLPQRAFEEAGLTGGWGTIAQYVVPLFVLAPIALWRWRAGKDTGLGFPLLGLLLGGGIVCYANSFLLTEVVRALLLFYLTPLWATLLELFVLRRPPGWSRAASLTLALAGVWVVFGTSGEFPWPRNAGDWLALTGGAMVAAGAARAQAVQPRGVFGLLFAFFFYGTFVALATAALLSGQLGPMPAMAAWADMLPWLLLLSLVFLIPTNGLLIWSPAKLGAGLFGILILAEIIFGTISAALWADEVFGWRQATGGGLIVLAGLVEVLLGRGPERSAKGAAP